MLQRLSPTLLLACDCVSTLWFECAMCILFTVFWWMRSRRSETGAGTSKSQNLQDKVKSLKTSSGKEPKLLVQQITELCQKRNPRGLELYEQMRSTGMAKHVSEHVYTLLCQSALHLGKNTVPASLLQDMKENNVPRSLGFYVSLMKMYASKHMFQKAMGLYEDIIEDSFEPDGIMYTCLINFAVECGEFDKAESFFALLQDVQTPSLKSYMMMIRVYSRRNDFQSALSLLKQMCEHGVEPDSLVLNNVLGTCVNAGQLEVSHKLMTEMKGMKVLDVISYNTLIKGYSQRGDFPQAMKVLQEMRDSGLDPNEITFNTLMDCAIRSKDTDGAWKILADMEKCGISPDKYTCSILIKGLQDGAKKEHINNSLKLIDSLGGNTDSGKLHDVLFHSMLDACAGVKDLKRMMGVFEQMKRQKVAPTSVTYGTIIKSLGQAGRLDKCFEMWDEMVNNKILPSQVTFGILLDACVNNGEIDKAVTVFDDMKKSGYAVNTVLYTTLIKGFAKAGKVDSAMALYKDMRTAKNVCVDQDGNTSRSTECIAPDLITYSILIKANCDIGNMEAAFKLLDEMKSFGYLPDEIVFNSLLTGCFNESNTELGSKLFQDMVELGVRPSNVTFSILVKMYGRCRMLDEAFAVVDRMKQFNVTPGVYTWTCLIHACVRNRQLKRAMEVFETMRKSTKPDSITYGALVNGCVYGNALEPAVDLVERAYAEGQTLPNEILNNLLSAVVRKNCVGTLGSRLYSLMTKNNVPVLAKLKPRLSKCMLNTQRT